MGQDQIATDPSQCCGEPARPGGPTNTGNAFGRTRWLLDRLRLHLRWLFIFKSLRCYDYAGTSGFAADVRNGPLRAAFSAEEFRDANHRVGRQGKLGVLARSET